MKNIFILFFSIAHFFLLSQEKEKRLALVMGNANYEKGELNNPVNDARLIASTLDSLEFDVILKENLATRRDMTNAIREFGAKRENYDVAFVYYAGHGIQIDDENFLLPTKENFFSEEDVLDYAVSVEKIMRILKSKDNQVNILILDACRDNPFESSWNNTRSLNGRGLAKIQPPTGSLIAFSTDSGQTAPDGNGDNSIYTSSLSRNMKIDDISIDQVFRNVRAEVLDQTNGQQRPL
ncbi:caspase family protein, partial [Flavobacteriaceae bacterium]|nr:caspase family protein [Flavobacteriaceae bacterium]